MSEKNRKKKLKNREISVSPPSLKMMESLFADIGPPRAATALDAAQKLMYKAWEENDRSRRVTLARKALLISPDCADAYCLLAGEDARSLDRVIEFYRKGMHAGERAIGKGKFPEFEGHFWGILETRPYMRARAGLAQCLWEAGKHQDRRSLPGVASPQS